MTAPEGEHGAADAAPDLAESLRQVGAAGRSGLDAATDSARALRGLIWADLALARSALGRALACSGIALAFGVSSWLLLASALVVWLSRGLGWSWQLALLVCGGVSLAVTLVAGWRALHYFEHTRLRATLRQLQRLGIGEPDPNPDPAASTTAADARAAP